MDVKELYVAPISAKDASGGGKTMALFRTNLQQ